MALLATLSTPPADFLHYNRCGLAPSAYQLCQSLHPRHIEAFGTEAWLKIQNTPPAWADKVLTVSVYAWDPAKNAWEAEPIATTDRKVWGGGKLWQHTLTLLAPKGSARAKAWRAAATPALPRGKYLVKVYVDSTGRTEKDWAAELGPADSVGEAEVTSAWPTGYGKMTVIDGSQVRKK